MFKKVISAVGDDFIINNLDKDSYETTGDIFEQEILFDMLKNDVFDFLVISTKIHGTHSKYSLIKQIRDINSKIKVIVITDEENREYEKYLESKNIKNVFIDGKFTFEDILNVLNKIENTTDELCPICNKELGQYPALSKKDNETKICSNCGMLEALEAFNKHLKESESNDENK